MHRDTCDGREISMRTLVIGLTLGLAAVGSCAKNEAPPATTTTTAAFIVPNETAIRNITSARCNREQACNNIGPGQRYDTVDVCTRELDHDTRSTIGADKCPNGVSDNELSSCLNDIRNERCGNPIDTVERVGACRKAKLCR